MKLHFGNGAADSLEDDAVHRDPAPVRRKGKNRFADRDLRIPFTEIEIPDLRQSIPDILFHKDLSVRAEKASLARGKKGKQLLARKGGVAGKLDGLENHLLPLTHDKFEDQVFAWGGKAVREDGKGVAFLLVGLLHHKSRIVGVRLRKLGTAEIGKLLDRNLAQARFGEYLIAGEKQPVLPPALPLLRLGQHRGRPCRKSQQQQKQPAESERCPGMQAPCRSQTPT